MYIPLAIELDPKTLRPLSTAHGGGVDGCSVYIAGAMMPVPPASIKAKIDNRNETVRLANGEALKILNVPGLIEYKLEILLPASPYVWANFEGLYKSPSRYLALFDRLKDQRQSFRFLVLVGSQPKISETCTLEDYDILDDAEDVGDIRVSLTLERYVEHQTEVLRLVSNEDGTMTAVSERADTAGVGTDVPAESSDPTADDLPIAEEVLAPYTVVQGDTLGAIALRFLGSFERYHELAEINNIANPGKIYPGDVIRFA